MKAFSYLLLMFALTACQAAGSKKQSAKHTQVIQHKDDSTLMTRPGAVLVYPSDRQIQAMQKSQKAGDYDAVVDDDQYYMGTSITYLDSVKAYHITRESEGVMKFKTSGGKIYKVNLSKMFFGIILFNGEDKPIDASTTDIEQEYTHYMLKSH